MNIRVQFCFRMNSGPGGLVIRSEVLFGIGKALKAHGIEIPFPQRDVLLRIDPADRALLAGGLGAGPADGLTKGADGR